MKSAKITRDSLKQNRFRKDLGEESRIIYGDERCYASHKPFKGLIASHIKPYKICCLEGDEYSQFNKNNGLLLSKQIDDYFDKLMITFDCEGKILFGDDVPVEIQEEFNTYYLDRSVFNAERREYMNIHRSLFFYKYYYALETNTPPERLKDITVPYYNCGIKVISGQCIVYDNNIWDICPSHKIKSFFIQKTGHAFAYSNADLLSKLIQEEQYNIDTIPRGLNTPHSRIVLKDGLRIYSESSFKICETRYDAKPGMPKRFCSILNRIFRNQENTIIYFRKAICDALLETGDQRSILCFGNQESINLVFGILKEILNNYIFEYNQAGRFSRKTTVSDSIPNCRILIANIQNKVITQDVFDKLLDNNFFEKTVLNVDRYIPFYISNKKIDIKSAYMFRFDGYNDETDIKDLCEEEGEHILYWLINHSEIMEHITHNGVPNDLLFQRLPTVEELVQLWMNQRCVVTGDFASGVRANDLYDDYQRFVKGKDKTPVSERKFFLEITKEWEKNKKRDSKGIFYSGIKLKDNDE